MNNFAPSATLSPLFRPAFASGLVLSAALFVVSSGGVAQAAPVPNLTFNINARVQQSEGSGISQSFQAKVLLHGNRTRVETTTGKQKAVTLVAPPYIYRLLPDSEAGVRWKMEGSRAKTFGGLGVDPQELIRNPGKIRALLMQNGAKRTGSSTLGGVAVDVYQLSQPKEQLTSARAYLRKSDALPVKFEATGKGLKISAVWSNYARPKDLPASLFRAPQNYRIRNSDGAPPLSLF